MQKTFLSSVGAKTNRLVHKTKQQRSPKQALFFFSSSRLLFFIFYSCHSYWQIHSKFTVVLACISSSGELGSSPVPLVQTRPCWAASLCAVNHFCQYFIVA